MPYITHIATTELRGIPPFQIDLGPGEGQEFRHLVLTGPNGTGKTSILSAIAAQVFADTLDGGPHDAESARNYALQSGLRAGQSRAELVRQLPFGHVELVWAPPIAALDDKARQGRPPRLQQRAPGISSRGPDQPRRWRRAPLAAVA